ncbi:DNA polymerase delta, subunit 4-domain-containing protein [Tuber indicum]|nr:DNA polymerase delta, subunit 4-domain-containing protein [Tuber indicum]
MPPQRTSKGKNSKSDPPPGQTLLPFQPAPKPSPSKPQPTLAEKGLPTITISLQQIQNYYNSQILEPMGCPPTHQQYLCMQEKILRNFDMQVKYGPCIGPTRWQRWKRAEAFGLNPPVEVLAVILAEELRDGVGVGSDFGRDSRRAYLESLLDIWG